ncbi:MAG: DUF3841 domain-containing protein [Fibrella sp.]|nr:DUF3841 domain-containing protein [Armatimonadota bacterium]
MRLWTIQPLAVWRILEHTGVFHTDPAHSAHKDDFPEAYDWIVRRLRQHAGPSPEGCELPIWAWHQWRGAARPKPDLRWFRHKTEGDFVRIAVEITDNEVLLSDFDLWYSCMNYWYLPVSRADDRRFTKSLRERGLDYYKTRPLPDPQYHARIEQSWERILDLDRVGRDKVTRENRWIQAVFWELRRDQVCEVTPFRGTWSDRKSRP